MAKRNIDVNRLLHRAHLRFQRASLAKDDTSALSCPELRDTRYRFQPKAWLLAQRTAQLNAILTGIRPNFWRAYLDTIVYMSK